MGSAHRRSPNANAAAAGGGRLHGIHPIKNRHLFLTFFASAGPWINRSEFRRLRSARLGGSAPGGGGDSLRFVGLSDHDSAQIAGIVSAGRCLAGIAADGRAAFDADGDARLAAEGALVSLGTHAAKLSARFREEHPGLPLPPVVTSRNQLVYNWHDGTADSAGLWHSVSVDVPALIAALEAEGIA